MRNAIIAILAVLLIAGCVGQTATGEGGTKVESADVIVTSGESVIPAQPVAGSAFSARFTVQNQHTDRTANSVGVWIYDTGRCELRKVNGINSADIIIGNGAQTMWPGLTVKTTQGYKYITDFSPGQQEVVRLDMTAPSKSQLGDLPGSCPIRYKVNYSFAAVSEMTAQAISADRLAAREQETGARPTFTRTLSIGAGPMRVYMEPSTAMPIESGQPLRVDMTVKNEGAGEISKIAIGQLSISLDGDWLPDLNGEELSCGGKFDEGTAGEGGRTVYTNVEEIPVVQKETNAITCEWKAPSVTLERQAVLQARMPYEYEYFGPEITVPVTP